MTRVYVTDDQKTYDRLKIGQLKVCLFSALADVEADEFVAVGPNFMSLMANMRAAGIPPEYLSYDDGVDIKDFYYADQKPIWDIQEPTDRKFLRCGISGLTHHLRWRLPEVVVVAGPYSSGKSLFAQILAQDFARVHSAPVSLTCWEDEADEIKAGLIRYRDTAMKQQHEGDQFREMFLDLFRITTVPSSADRKLSDHFDRMRYQAKRFGTKFFVLDPWNEFDHERARQQTETEYVREVMKAVRRLADELKIIILITTHVSAEFIGNDGSIKPFRVAHSFGSSQFANKMDRGFCVIRTDKWGPQTHMLLRQDKVKLEDRWAGSGDERRKIQERMGNKGTFVFEYSAQTNSLYWDADISKDESVQKIWRG